MEIIFRGKPHGDENYVYGYFYKIPTPFEKGLMNLILFFGGRYENNFS